MVRRCSRREIGSTWPGHVGPGGPGPAARVEQREGPKPVGPRKAPRATNAPRAPDNVPRPGIVVGGWSNAPVTQLTSEPAPGVATAPVARGVARASPSAGRTVPARAQARSYRLVRGAVLRRPAFEPDETQRRVIAHRRGPLLVLAGPGTGKTTTLVEAVARRVERGLRPEQVLVLTFSRRAALELRERLTARLQRALPGPLAWTFHAWCYALVRQAHPCDGLADPPRLLSGPEQDVVLRDLLRGSLDTGRPRWPAAMRSAMGTRGLAEEVRALLGRARDVGVDPGELAVLAAWEGRDDWSALADFYADYLDVLDAQGALDYAELVSRAVALASRPDIGRSLRSSFRAVFVDEYQDTDPSQERLLQALAGGGGDLVAVGDPDQAIYGFRGADVKGLLQFRDRFRRSDGQLAPVVALQTCRRSGSELVAVTRRFAWGIPAPGLPAQMLRQHRELAAASTGGRVNVATYPSPGAQAEAVADLLRRERARVRHRVASDGGAGPQRCPQRAGAASSPDRGWYSRSGGRRRSSPRAGARDRRSDPWAAVRGRSGRVDAPEGSRPDDQPARRRRCFPAAPAGSRPAGGRPSATRSRSIRAHACSSRLRRPHGRGGR